MSLDKTIKKNHEFNFNVIIIKCFRLYLVINRKS